MGARMEDKDTFDMWLDPAVEDGYSWWAGPGEAGTRHGARWEELGDDVRLVVAKDIGCWLGFKLW